MNTLLRLKQNTVSLFRKHIRSGLLIFAALLANFCNFLYNAYLSRVTGYAEFGVVSLIGSFLSLTQIPLSSYTRSITHLSAFRYGKEKRPASEVWFLLRKRSLVPTILLVGLWIVSIPLLTSLFQTPDITPYLLFTPIWTIGVYASVDSGFLGGSLRFQTLALMTIIEAVIKLALTIILVETQNMLYVYMAIPVSACCSFVYGWYKARKLAITSIKDHRLLPRFSLSKKFFTSSVFSKITTLAFLNMDVLLVKHYLPPVEAGKYALLSTIGKMVYFLGSLFTQFITPLISHHEGSKTPSQKTFLKLMLLTVLISMFGVGIFGLYGNHTAVFLFGSNATAITPYLLQYTFGMACIVCAGAIAGYHQAKRNHLFSFVGGVISFGMLGVIYLYHDSISVVAQIVSYTGIVWLGSTILLHLIQNTLVTLSRNIIDFFSVFLFSPFSIGDTSHSKRILILNWRDTKHIWAGGAEVYIHELAKRLVKNGHVVTVFCGNDGKCPRNEVVDGVQIIRRGGFYTVYLWACIYYLFRLRNYTDLVIESMNGIPFFTPLYASVPTCLMVHHIHQEVFRKHLLFPFSYIAMFVESKLMPFIYRKQQIITVSDSSKKQIIKHNLAKAERVTVIVPGITQMNSHTFKKSKSPLFSYVGRLKPYKNIDTVVKSFFLIQKKYDSAKLIIAGWGESAKYLKKLVRNLGIEDKVIFKGYVSEKEKFRIMGSSWGFIHASSVEGWGITVIEANSVGTPVVGSHVYGLKDSIIHNKTGFLVPVRNIYSFAKAMEKIVSNKVLRHQMEEQAKEWSTMFDWDISAQSLLQLINKQLISSQKQSIISLSVSERSSV